MAPPAAMAGKPLIADVPAAIWAPVSGGTNGMAGEVKAVPFTAATFTSVGAEFVLAGVWANSDGFEVAPGVAVLAPACGFDMACAPLTFTVVAVTCMVAAWSMLPAGGTFLAASAA